MRILMCRPDYFDIIYEINPWMDLTKNVDQKMVRREWDNLYNTIINCGATVDLIPPQNGLPDMVFTANAGVLYHDKIILPHFKFKQRQGELVYYEDWFKKNGFQIANTVTNDTPYFEGAGDALGNGKKYFVGYGFRSDKSFYETTPFFNQEELVYCELTDPYFYHIDTCFCPLNEKLAIWYPNAFTTETQTAIKNATEVIAVDQEEAQRFACNAVVIDKNVILPSECPNISHKLEQHGFIVHPCEMNEFLKSGGACKCLTLRIA